MRCLSYKANQFIIKVDLYMFIWDLMVTGPGGTEISVYSLMLMCFKDYF